MTKINGRGHHPYPTEPPTSSTTTTTTTTAVPAPTEPTPSTTPPTDPEPAPTTSTAPTEPTAPATGPAPTDTTPAPVTAAPSSTPPETTPAAPPVIDFVGGCPNLPIVPVGAPVLAAECRDPYPTDFTDCAAVGGRYDTVGTADGYAYMCVPITDVVVETSEPAQMLPATGAGDVAFVTGGAVMLLLGAVLVAGARRR